MKETEAVLTAFRSKLENHPVYEAVSSIEDLRCFMEHHVYSVWDFMSLIKYLQSVIAPTHYPWIPLGDPTVCRFINELVLEEESDETHIPGEYSSHFELYQRAMLEVGANITPSYMFTKTVYEMGIEDAMKLPNIPEPSRKFTKETFSCILNRKPHEAAAFLALGREHLIPLMFRSMLLRIDVSEREAPIFHYYLKRHIHLDEDFHAPLSLRLLDALCGDDKQKQQEALDATERAVNARVTFWDGVCEALSQRKQSVSLNTNCHEPAMMV